jgi:hypothetical protein
MTREAEDAWSLCVSPARSGKERMRFISALMESALQRGCDKDSTTRICEIHVRSDVSKTARTFEDLFRLLSELRFVFDSEEVCLDA